MSMGMIKSGEYVPCGASATLMSQYPMKPATDIVPFTTGVTTWTAPCAGILTGFGRDGSSGSITINGVSVAMWSTHEPSGAEPESFVLNKGDIIAISGGEFYPAYTWWRPFAVGEVL